MATSNRITKIGKIHKVLKKAGYETVAPDPQRTVLEQLLFAACLEDAKYDAAEQAFAALGHNFFDWNEVRVTTVRELAEEMSCLPNPTQAAQRVKDILQSVFEAKYAFDLEELRKENLGPATEQLNKTNGSSPFVVSYVIQAALGGHSIPIDGAAMQVITILDLAKEKDIESRSVPGMERAIPKNKGIEFGAMLHQFAVEFAATPHKAELRKIVLEIDPDAGDRLPKRRTKQAAAASSTTKKKPAAKAKPEKPASKKAAPAAKKTAKTKAKKTPPKPKAKSTKKSPASKKAAKTKASAPASKKSSRKRSTSKGLSKKKPR